MPSNVLYHLKKIMYVFEHTNNNMFVILLDTSALDI